MRPPIDPAEAADLLIWLKRHGFWAVHLGRNPAEPTVIVLFRKHNGWVDVVHVRGADRVEAARMPSGETADIWQPSKVTWLSAESVPATGFALGVERVVTMLEVMGLLHRNRSVSTTIGLREGSADALVDPGPRAKGYRAAVRVAVNYAAGRGIDRIISCEP